MSTLDGICAVGGFFIFWQVWPNKGGRPKEKRMTVAQDAMLLDAGRCPKGKGYFEKNKKYIGEIPCKLF